MACGIWYYTVAVAELVGVLLGAYGVLRESFADLAGARPYGEGRFGEGTYGGHPSAASQRWIRVAVWLRLLPPDRNLTITDRRRNAAAAVMGLLILVLAMLADVAVVGVRACSGSPD